MPNTIRQATYILLSNYFAMTDKIDTDLFYLIRESLSNPQMIELLVNLDKGVAWKERRGIFEDTLEKIDRLVIENSFGSQTFFIDISKQANEFFHILIRNS